MLRTVDGHHMRPNFPSKLLGLGGVLLLTLAVLMGQLRAQDADVSELPPPPDEAAPAAPAFDLDLVEPSAEKSGPGQFKGRDRDPEVAITWSPLAGQPDTAVLAIHVKLQEGANTYGLDPVEGFRKNTKITIDDLNSIQPIDEKFVADHPPKVAKDPNFPGLDLQKHFGEVTLLRRYRIQGTPPAVIKGKYDMLVCRTGCTPHKDKFEASWSSEPYTGSVPDLWKTESAEAPPVEQVTDIEVVKSGTPLSLGYALVLAFFGGMIMNIMPCVLPVIAIKVLSFVQQAGESRSRIFALNLTYAVGVIVVFLGLGTLATFARIGLGQLFQYDGFNVVMACVVFAMGLSLLGVFEFQLPGSVGGANEHEGLTGAFFTGILATLLATPCIGPFVSGVLVWSVTQPAAVIYLIWGTLGLGMASPYLLIGMFPSLINRMPRPGMWMVRFKEFSGFVLMATVIFLINSISPALLIPTLVILLGIALALWMMGNLYDHSTPDGQKWKVRLAAAVISLPLIGWGVVQHVGIERVYAALNMKPQTQDLPWQPFTSAKLVELRKLGQPLLIDFTADWCVICKANERLALNTEATAAFVKSHNVVCLKADYTDESEEITEWLQRFGAAGVPLTVVFPPGEKSKGIPFDGPFTQSSLLNTMEKAWKETGSSSPNQAMALDKKSITQ